jgi:hypothetical protein
LLPTRLLANRWAEALQMLVAAAVAVARRFGANEHDLWSDGLAGGRRDHPRTVARRVPTNMIH